MLNEEKIKLMTHMAAYEAHEGKKDIAIGSYFRGDYVGLNILFAFIAATISYVIVVGLAIYYHFEEVMKDIYQVDLLETGKNMLIWYIVIVGIYTVICYIYHSIRYAKAKKSLKGYSAKLKNLTDI